MLKILIYSNLYYHFIVFYRFYLIKVIIPLIIKALFSIKKKKKSKHELIIDGDVYLNTYAHVFLNVRFKNFPLRLWPQAPEEVTTHHIETQVQNFHFL